MRKSDSEADNQNLALKLRTTPVSAAPTSVGIAPTKGAAGENMSRTMSYPVSAVTAVEAAANSNPPRAVDSYPRGKLGTASFSFGVKPRFFFYRKRKWGFVPNPAGGGGKVALPNRHPDSIAVRPTLPNCQDSCRCANRTVEPTIRTLF